MFLSILSFYEELSVAVHKMPAHEFPQEGKSPQFHNGISGGARILVKQQCPESVLPCWGTYLWEPEGPMHPQ